MKPKDSKWCPYPPHRHLDHWKWEGVRPPRHWFFMRILSAFFLICLALAVIPLFSGGHFSLQNIPQHLFWTLVVIFIGFAMLRRMFRPLRMLMKGVQEISNGNLDFQFKARGRHGEIQYLSEHFNLMVQRVREMVESKQQLLLDVSHELRSPLTRLKVALEMTPKSKMKESMLQDIGEMETMLTEILETERLKNGNGKLSLSSVEMTGLVKEILDKYQGRKPGVKFMNPSSKKIILQADEARIKTVLQNIVENALKYSARQDHPVEVSLEQGKEIKVTVRDFGIGVAPEDRERIFEPFYRVDKSRTKETGGYGLGLSLCREIMRAHQGEVLIEDAPPQGTKVLLFFPIQGPDAA
jgi:signal transduction histidine kinase